jgi:hypothetical protein
MTFKKMVITYFKVLTEHFLGMTKGKHRELQFFFLILDCEAISTAATPGLLCQPRVIMKLIVEK